MRVNLQRKMAVKNILLKVMKHSPQGFRPVLHYLLAGFLFGLLAWQHTFASAGSTLKDAGAKENYREVLSDIGPYADLSFLHLPFQPAPAPKDFELLTENEPEEDSDSHFVTEGNAINNFSPVSYSAVPLAPLPFAVETQNQVPLFILYHSWKSFMC